MSVLRAPALVSCQWLKQKIASGATSAAKKSAPVRVLDTSWMPEPEIDGYTSYYKKAHIPTALFMDLKKISPKRPDSPIDCPIPDANFFQDYVEHLGINNETHVIAYDSLNCRPSVRTWFLFRLFGHDMVSMLNGGMTKWVEEGNEVVKDEYKVPVEKFKVNFRPDLLMDFVQMREAVKSKKSQIIDSRPKTNGFYITDQDKSGGHMPGAISMPFPSFFNKDNTFKEASDLNAMFAKAGVNLDKPLIATCQRGMTANAVSLAAAILEKGDVPMYNGSWFEWNEFANDDLIVRQKEKS